jgi:Ca-activated chloride channel family protein
METTKNCYLLLMLMAGSIFLTAIAGGDGIVILDPPPDRPALKLDEALAIRYHHVDVTIYDQVATTRVDQAFFNDLTWTAEGTYIFPLPEEAAVTDFVLWADGEPVRGEILEADEARKIYTDIVRRTRDPALLEYVDRKALKARVFPIPSGEERRIELEYSQVLPMDNGLVHYVYPLSTERFSSKPLEEVVITVDLRSQVPIRAVYSPSHPVFVEREGDRSAFASFEDEDVLPDRDFELYYSVSPEDVGISILSYKEPGEDGFFMLLAAPKVEVEAGDIVARDLILVLDVSGSMEGEKIDEAKEAAIRILDGLNPTDRFNVVAFSSGLQTFSRGLEPASKRGEGIEFVRGLSALGGTNINRALLEAAAMADPQRPATMIFLTDGLATVGVEDAGKILQNVDETAPDGLRIFTFGVGDDVDTDLLDQLSTDHGGASAYVRPGQRIDETVSAFYAKIKSPVLSDVVIDFGSAETDRIYPESTPDLFAGSQLVLVGRYRTGGETKITLSGTFNERIVSIESPGVYFAEAGGADFIPRLWATRAIGSYLRKIRLHGEEDELVDAIVTLSIRYGIITPYTSFLIDEEDIFSGSGRDAVSQKFRRDMEADSAAASYGPSAVEKAAFQGEMAAAEVPHRVPSALYSTTGSKASVSAKVAAGEVIREVGPKTFVLRNGTWIDTAFEGTEMETVKVRFLSDEYFDLISDRPRLGGYFALGERVIVVVDGAIYEVVEV